MRHAFLNSNVQVPLNTPGSATTSTINSDWVGLEHGTCAAFMIIIEEGRANQADDNTLTFRQATDAAGASVKEFVPRRAYRRAHATNIASAAAAKREEIDSDDMHIDGDMHTIYEVEIDASELDVNNDFTHLQAGTSQVGGSTTKVTITATVADLRHKMDPVYLPNVLE